MSAGWGPVMEAPPSGNQHIMPTADHQAAAPHTASADCVCKPVLQHMQRDRATGFESRQYWHNELPGDPPAPAP